MPVPKGEALSAATTLAGASGVRYTPLTVDLSILVSIGVDWEFPGVPEKLVRRLLVGVSEVAPGEF